MCLLYNHSFKTNPNTVTNLSKLFNYIAPASLLYTVIVNHWLINWGFTIGVADTVAGNDTLLEIDTIIQDAKKQVSGLVKKGQVSIQSDAVSKCSCNYR